MALKAHTKPVQLQLNNSGAWIRIDDAMPPTDRAVLLASRAWFDGEGVIPSFWHQWVHMAIVKNPLSADTVVTHWMPVPMPPCLSNSSDSEKQAGLPLIGEQQRGA